MEAISGSVGSRFQVYSDGEFGEQLGIKFILNILNIRIYGGGVFKILLRKNYSALIYGITMQAY